MEFFLIFFLWKPQAFLWLFSPLNEEYKHCHIHLVKELCKQSDFFEGFKAPDLRRIIIKNNNISKPFSIRSWDIFTFERAAFSSAFRACLWRRSYTNSKFKIKNFKVSFPWAKSRKRLSISSLLQTSFHLDSLCFQWHFIEGSIKLFKVDFIVILCESLVIFLIHLLANWGH